MKELKGKCHVSRWSKTKSRRTNTLHQLLRKHTESRGVFSLPAAKHMQWGELWWALELDKANWKRSVRRRTEWGSFAEKWLIASGKDVASRFGLWSFFSVRLKSLYCHSAISSPCVPLLKICIIPPKPPVYLFICMWNIGHTFIQTIHF